MLPRREEMRGFFIFYLSLFFLRHRLLHFRANFSPEFGGTKTSISLLSLNIHYNNSAFVVSNLTTFYRPRRYCKNKENGINARGLAFSNFIFSNRFIKNLIPIIKVLYQESFVLSPIKSRNSTRYNVMSTRTIVKSRRGLWRAFLAF